MVKKEAREIDGVTFEVSALDLKTERGVLVRLAKVCGPAIAELALGGGTAEAKAPQALRALFAGLDEGEIDYLIETFRAVTKIQMATANGGSLPMPLVDSAFKGGAAHQLKWLWFCLEHQFTDFLGSISGMFAGLLEKRQAQAAASGSSSPQI